MMTASARQPLLLHAAVMEQFSSGISFSTALQFSTVGVAPILRGMVYFTRRGRCIVEGGRYAAGVSVQMYVLL